MLNTRMIKLSTTAAALAIALVGAGSADAQDGRYNPQPSVMAGAGPKMPDIRPVTDKMIQSPEPGEWLMFRGNLASWGYSPLKQITTKNVGQLRLVWAHGINGGKQEGTPLIHDGVMFFPEPSDVITAIDARTGDTLWQHRHKLPADLKDHLNTSEQNRSLAIWEDLIIDTSPTNTVFALEAKTGKQVWETQITDYKTDSGQPTSGPIIANGKVISGRGCVPRGGPDACVITAHDARTGKELWRFHIIPRPGEPGDESWGGIPYESRWHVGAWMVPSFDPELNLIYIGTSVTSPAVKFALAGNDKDYLYHNSTLAIDADTGKLVWHYQHVVDHWDLDHPFDRYLLEAKVAPDPKSVEWINPKIKPGEVRKVVSGIPGKTGIFYTLDAKTGEFLWATPTTKQNVVSNIDGATGKVTVNPEAQFHAVGETHLICPSAFGGKNWPSGAYNPQKRMMYFGLLNTCMNETAVLDKPSLESAYGFRSTTLITPGETNVGTLRAISPDTGKVAWLVKQRAGFLSLTATAGDLLFIGDVTGHFKAIDQNNGKTLWDTNLGAVVTGYPISYAVNGKQYVAVSTGTSTNTGGILALTPEFRSRTDSMLYVFALPDGVR